MGSSRRSRFGAMGNVGSAVDEVALGQVLLQLLRFSHVIIMTLVRHTCPHLQNYSYQTDKRSKPGHRLTNVTFYRKLKSSSKIDVSTPTPVGSIFWVNLATLAVSFRTYFPDDSYRPACHVLLCTAHVPPMTIHPPPQKPHISY